MKLAICAIIKNESAYLDEWISYHLKMVDHIYLYDNNSDEPITYDSDQVTVTSWPDDGIGSQMRAYMHRAKLSNDDYIAFIDMDEFIVCDDLRGLLTELKWYHGMKGLGVSWRFYGSNPPYTRRHKQEEYIQYHPNEHIKSILDPKSIIRFPDPHCAVINGLYINENEEPITGPLNPHTSNRIYIKHIYTRSLPEWEEKIKRGSGDKVFRKRGIEDFYNYNNSCIYED